MSQKKKAQWSEFDCPVCDANNPMDEGFTYGDELFCSWCGSVFIVKVVSDDVEVRYRLVEA